MDGIECRHHHVNIAASLIFTWSRARHSWTLHLHWRQTARPKQMQRGATRLINVDLPSRPSRKALSISCDAMEEQIEGIRARHMPHLVPCEDPSAIIGARDRRALDLVLKNGAGPGQAMGVAGNLEFTVVQAIGD